MTKIVNHQEFGEMIKEGSGWTLLDVFAPWCGPCKMLGPIIESIEKDLPNVNVLKLNADENADFLTEYKVNAFPTIILFNQNHEVSRFEGFRDKEFIINFVKSKQT